jgi:hypothetical protein
MNYMTGFLVLPYNTQYTTEYQGKHILHYKQGIGRVVTEDEKFLVGSSCGMVAQLNNKKIAEYCFYRQNGGYLTNENLRYWFGY